MPFTINTHVLRVDDNQLRNVDMTDPAIILRMWALFSRCKDSIEQGRRLENLCWRLLQKRLPVDNETRQITQDVPQLFGSVDTLVDDDASELISCHIHRHSSHSDRRNHGISSNDVEKLFAPIIKDNGPLVSSTTASPVSVPKKRASITPAPTPKSIANVEAGILGPKSTSAHKPQKPAQANFSLGGPCSSGEQCVSDEINPGPSSRKISQPVAKPPLSKKPKAESAVDSDTDDGWSDWEDSSESSGNASVDGTFFPRVKSTVDLASRLSTITSLLAGTTSQQIMTNQASSTTRRRYNGPRGDSDPEAMPDDSEEVRTMKSLDPSKASIEVPLSAAPVKQNHAAVLSPQETRKSMIKKELSEKQRESLHRLRKVNSMPADAVPRHSHTSYHVDFKRLLEQHSVDSFNCW